MPTITKREEGLVQFDDREYWYELYYTYETKEEAYNTSADIRYNCGRAKVLRTDKGWEVWADCQTLRR